MTRLGGQAPDATEVPPAPADSQPRIKAALWFADAGFGVFPCWSALPDGTCRCPAGPGCPSPAKHPLTANGFKDATTDAKRIRTFMSAASRPNYGLVCPDGVFALDVDGDGWEARLAELEAQHGPLPPTLRTQTRNGQHIFLRWPDGLPRPIKQMFGWVTRWGSGGTSGYVIGPRSVHATGFEYAPVGVFQIAELPEAWAKAAVQPDATTLRVGGLPDPSSVLPGSRHDTLRNIARYYAGTVRDPDALFAAVWAFNEKMPEPKTVDEVKRAIGDALVKFPADPVEVDEATGEVRREVNDAIGLLAPKDDDGLFPADPEPVAFGGLLGEMVAFLMQGTDASPVGLLASLTAFCGALVPSGAYFHGNQTGTPFLALVGHSSIGRKGTAMYRARDALGYALQMDTVNRVKFDGLASGEALVTSLIHRAKEPPYGPPTGLLFEEEYATFLAAAGRDGSTLDSRMRAAFDGKQLSHRKVSETMVVPEPYYLAGLVAITPAELQAKVTKESFKSGSGNRWLWLPVRRRDVVVDSTEPVLPGELSRPLVEAYREATREPLRLSVGSGVAELLAEYDRFLYSESVGLAADMTRRFAVIAFRAAMVHAAIERSVSVTRDHALRTVALTEYARRGLDWTFGQALGDGLATLLLRQLQEESVLTQGTISKYLIRDPQKRQAAVDELVRLGLATVERVKTGGRVRSELRLVAQKGDFRDFRALIEGSQGLDTRLVRETRERAQTASAEGAHKGGEVRESRNPSATWLRPCKDYQAHQGPAHRLVAGGWVCTRCDEEE
jgi:hypothetical protein